MNDIKLSIPMAIIYTLLIALGGGYVKNLVSTTASTTQATARQDQATTDISNLRVQVDDIRRNYVSRIELDTQFKSLQSSIEDLKGDVREVKRWAIEKVK